mmetsp:Transcript_5458/g.11195  ORF Transcript_5458/g.11195 Transcript_5458/m.11195 type:complete len:291 (-) Transcript_5458:53-925(-)
MQRLPPTFVQWALSKISSNMKSPTNTLRGQLAMYIMKTFNPPSIHAAVKRLELKSTDTFLEIGAGHGESLKALVEIYHEQQTQQQNLADMSNNAKKASSPSRSLDDASSNMARSTTASIEANNSDAHGNNIPQKVILVEISSEFQRTLHHLIQNEIPKNMFPTPIEVHDTDCKSMTFLEDNSVDTIFGFNLVYFLHPLEEYISEIKRVLKPGGKLVFGCKFGSLPKKGACEVFVNVDRREICMAMEKAGFVDVVSEKVMVGDDNPMMNYVEIRGYKEEEDGLDLQLKSRI